MISLRNVSKYYYSNEKITLGLSKVDLDLSIGEFVVITGESGSGKSTLLNVLSGLDTFEQGKMYINNQDITHFTSENLEEYRRKYIGFVFQSYNIIESYSVFDNIEMALIVQGFDKDKRKDKVIELIEKVGLTSKIEEKASKLSGGEKQRIVIARALAKDSKIIVCDEPTGNLDSKSAKKIINLLNDLRKDKLIIVVSHNSVNYEKIMTRKIRLFDGDIVEDKVISEGVADPIINIKDKNKVKTSDLLKISLKNVISVPRKSSFTWLIISFIIIAFIFLYGANLEQKNTYVTFETPYFNNSVNSRIILTKHDGTAFSDAELETIKNTEYVREIIEYDYVFDATLLNKYYNESFDIYEYLSFKILPAISLNEFDLIDGELPDKTSEIVISENSYYQIGDIVHVSNENHIQEIGLDDTTDYTFTVVGIVSSSNNLADNRMNLYFTKGAILGFKYDAMLEHSQMFITLEGTHEYSVYQDIRINDDLNDFQLLGYDAMFYDMCLDLGLETCIINDFVANHDFEFKAITRFEPESNETTIEFISVPFVEGAFGQAIYMNTATMDYFLEESAYQVTAVVYDKYEANTTIPLLEEEGFNVFYPHGIVTVEEGLLLVLNNIRLFFSLLFTLLVVYFIGYFVMRNVMISKKQNYLIYRSVGASKEAINKVSIFEIMIITLSSFMFIFILLVINENINSIIPRYLRYFEVLDYIVLLITIFGVMYFMGRRFNKRIYNNSVITSLRDMR